MRIAHCKLIVEIGVVDSAGEEQKLVQVRPEPPELAADRRAVASTQQTPNRVAAAEMGPTPTGPPSLTTPLLNTENLEIPETPKCLEDAAPGCAASKGGADGEEGACAWVTVELKKQLWIAAPMITVNFLEYALLVVSVMFVGRLGELELASASLATSFASVSGFSLLIGMGGALETLCGQAYGAKQYPKLGLYLQRGTLLLTLTVLPVTVLWCNVGRVLLVLGQEPAIAARAGSYVRLLVPSLYANAALQPLVKFLQAQSLTLPMACASVATLACHAALCHLLIFRLGAGAGGAAIATSVSNWLNVGLLAAYVRFSGRCKVTRPGGGGRKLPPREALRGLRGLFQLAVPSAVMVCMEYWSFEVLVLLSGLLPNPRLETSALSVCLTTSTLMYMIPYGVGAATSTRVANELGAGNPRAARRAVAVSVALAVAEGSTVALALFAGRNWWGWAFTNEAEVARYVAQLMPILAVFAIMDALQGVLSGVVRGGGWQAYGAAANLGSYYAVGLPVGIVMAFAFDYKDFGFFVGMMCGMVAQVLILSTQTLRTDWEQQARDAVARVRATASAPEVDDGSEKRAPIAAPGVDERALYVTINAFQDQRNGIAILVSEGGGTYQAPAPPPH